jgi:hypothetical protein
MKHVLLILVAFAAVSCQSQSTGPRDDAQEPMPMGSGRMETKIPGEM